jgi:2-dehydro-3-deoxyphosphogluconate aldolase / (4S)-4-hydroxy-2-oxoglutarate aldolase
MGNMTLTDSSVTQVLTRSAVIPVMVIDELNQAEPLAEALLKGGLSVFEVTLRTAPALQAIELLSKRFPEAIVGAGTVVQALQLKQALAAGAQFLVSPGLSVSLAKLAAQQQVAYLPGIATATELMTGLDCGLDTFKFFPAVPAGGVAMLKAFHSAFAQVKFCPTGGIQFDNAATFLSLPNVLTVGMSAVCPPELLRRQDYAEIERLARRAAALRR